MLSSSLRRASIDTPCALRRYATLQATLHKPLDGSEILVRDVRRIKGTAKRLIRGAREAGNPEWRHTSGKKGEGKRLEREMVAKRHMREARKSTNIFATRPEDTEAIEEFLHSATSVLQPGTYVELRR